VQTDPQSVLLRNGLRMPLIGLGTWKSAKEGEVARAVEGAIKAGYKHIDCAWDYQNQNEVGNALSEAFLSREVKREDLWITSKLWNSFHAASDVEEHCRDTLSQLKLSYLDLYLIHWPVTGCESEALEPSYQETWFAMEELLQKGLVRTIGVSNLSAKKLLAMQDYANVFPMVNQVEIHPLWRQDHLLKVCKNLGTAVTAYAPLGSPDSGAIFGHQGASVMKHPVITEIANRIGKSPAQVCIRWAIQRGTSAIPKSTHVDRIAQNLDAFSWELSEDDFAKLSTIEPQRRMLTGASFGGWIKPQTGPYRTTQELWDEDENGKPLPSSSTDINTQEHEKFGSSDEDVVEDEGEITMPNRW